MRGRVANICLYRCEMDLGVQKRPDERQGSARDKICRKDSRDRFMTIKFKIRTVLETSDTYSYEFKSFCHVSSFNTCYKTQI